MWHEARRREKTTQKLFNDHKRRAEKWREVNRIDPHSLLLVNGTKIKPRVDPTIYKQANRSLMPWQGDKNILIDRFDVRATITVLPKDTGETKSNSSDHRSKTVVDINESGSLKKLLNYERYRSLIINDLNQTSEVLRLKLIANSEIASDATMKKLKSNRFGTSAEDIKTSLLPAISNLEPDRRYESSNTKSVCIPPPACLIESQRDTTAPRNTDKQIEIPPIIDLDDYDDFDLEHVDVSKIDGTKLNDITQKYGLSGLEFIFLYKREASEDEKLCDIAKEFDRFCAKYDKEESSTQRKESQDDQVYGPFLPAETCSPKHSGSVSSAESSPVRQRSPSGLDIPLPKSPPPRQSREPSCESNDNNQHGSSRTNLSQSNVEPTTPTRRASTPLIYKRRSSRSPSRERHHKSKSHSRKSRHRHRSRSHSSSPSSSSPSPDRRRRRSYRRDRSSSRSDRRRRS